MLSAETDELVVQKMEFLRASPFSAVLLLYFMLGFKHFLLKTCFSSPLSPSLQRVLSIHWFQYRTAKCTFS
jgi:hypothetical protein